MLFLTRLAMYSQTLSGMAMLQQFRLALDNGDAGFQSPAAGYRRLGPIQSGSANVPPGWQCPLPGGRR